MTSPPRTTHTERMSEPFRRVALLGGTFDPIHYGHLLLAEQAREQFELDSVVFVPNGHPAHKESYLVSDAETRYEMCLAATASNPAFACSRVEIERPGPSYAFDTISLFRQQYPELKALFFIVGADAMLEIGTWHRYKELGRQCEFIAATRPGANLKSLRTIMDNSFLGRVHLLQIPSLDISSSDLRERARTGRSLRYQTPDAVEAYIQSRGLYREGPLGDTCSERPD